MLTKEGIPVKTDIGLTFAIDPGDEPSPLRPYPFALRGEVGDEAAVAKPNPVNG